MTHPSEEPGTAPAEDERLVEIGRLIATAQGYSAQLHEVQAALERVRPLREAADQGDEEAERRLEEIAAEGTKNVTEYDESFRQCREAADAGDAISQRKLGEMLLSGAPVHMDFAQLEGWMAELREWLAMFNERMQAMREGREGEKMPDVTPGFPRSVAPDPAEAARWFRLAAEQGDTLSQRYLVEIYAEGRGVPKDPDESMRWCQRSAEAGDVRGQAQYGVLLLERSVGTPAEAEAVRWLEAAGNAGDVWAQYTLGVLYEDKRDEPEERAKALPWFRMAAEQNHAESLFHLAEYHRWGEVIPRDEAEAVRLYREAVAADPAVFRNLGFPAKWTGSDEDHAVDLSWFGKFADEGEGWAKEVLDGLIAMREEPLIELDLD